MTQVQVAAPDKMVTVRVSWPRSCAARAVPRSKPDSMDYDQRSLAFRGRRGRKNR